MLSSKVNDAEVVVNERAHGLMGRTIIRTQGHTSKHTADNYHKCFQEMSQEPIMGPNLEKEWKDGGHKGQTM